MNSAGATQNWSFLEKIEVEHHRTAEKARFPPKISKLSVTEQLKIEIASKNIKAEHHSTAQRWDFL